VQSPQQLDVSFLFSKFRLDIFLDTSLSLRLSLKFGLLIPCLGGDYTFSPSEDRVFTVIVGSLARSSCLFRGLVAVSRSCAYPTSVHSMIVMYPRVDIPEERG
jgi:hypothetical protein